MIDVEKTVADITNAIRNFMAAEEFSYRKGYLQEVAGELKIIGTLFLIFLAVTSKNLTFPLILLSFSIILALLSRISLTTYLSRFYVIPLFSLIIVLPLVFINANSSIYGISINRSNLNYVILFTSRVVAAVACISLLLFTTRFSSVLAALRRLRVPSTLTNVMAIVYRYLFTFLTELNDMIMGRRSRMIVRKRNIKGAAQFAGNFMSRIIFKSEAIYTAMRARGFDGRMRTFDRRFVWNEKSISYALMVAAMVFLWVMTEL